MMTEGGRKLGSVLWALCLQKCMGNGRPCDVCVGCEGCQYQQEIHHSLNRAYLSISDSGLLTDAMLSCNTPRQDLLVLLICQLGAESVLKQPAFLQALIAGQWLLAAGEMAKSIWARQHSSLVTYCIRILLSGEWVLPSVRKEGEDYLFV